ncbi:hypothetical protein LCGC14_1940710 [marine sediment metagenome]|uniref:Uncharacterized protein n=1 Tax=marine sediment metagenome TaxID=412755 RepID=A0A0F9IHS7_9ZZZZ
MIVSELLVQYICPGCGKTGRYSVYGLHEEIERIYEKNIKAHVGISCMECHKAKTVVQHAEMKLKPSDVMHEYELKWHCKDCGWSWSQYRYLAKKQINSKDTAVVLKNSTYCVCNNSNREFFLVSFVQKL